MRSDEQAAEFVGRGAQDFAKPALKIHEFGARNWKDCVEGAQSLAPGGAIVGAFFGPEGIVPGAAIGGGLGRAADVTENEVLNP